MPSLLKSGHYYLDHALTPEQAFNAAFGWALERYRFDRYRPDGSQDGLAVISVPQGCDLAALEQAVSAHCWVRDLVNIPANDFGPDELESEARALAETFGATLAVTRGDDLLSQNFPLIHAVGRASDRAPRLLDLTWGNPDHPWVTVIGKGLCFDSGGLDIKNAAGMRHMKIDMGGAAQTLALGYLVMAAGLPLRLRLLIPALDNNVSANAYRPGDVIKARNGLFVEIANTDAEGRLAMADALALADEEEPDLIIDFATLTGSCEIALGPDIPAILTADHDLALTLLAIGRETADPVWPLPLWPDYDDRLKSKIADCSNIAEGFMAGAITAGLFLKKFVTRTNRYIHVDYTGMNDSSRPGRPAGGEAQGVRAIHEYLRRFSLRETAGS